MDESPQRLGFLHGFMVLVFSLAACAVIFFLGRTYYLHAMTASWAEVPAQVLDWDLRQSRNSSNQSRLMVSYRYTYAGRSYEGNRTDFSLGSDNFSGARRGRQIAALKANTLKVFVNEGQPAESVMDRSLPAQQVAFAVFFLCFPCGLGTAFGLGLMLKLITKVSGRDTDRWFMPCLGLVHGVPALYPLCFAFGELSPGSGLILALFGALFALSLTEAVRRALNPAKGQVNIPPPPKAVPIRRQIDLDNHR